MKFYESWQKGNDLNKFFMFFTMEIDIDDLRKRENFEILIFVFKL